MTYEQFKEYLLTHLWKQGDTLVFNNLSVVIATAEAELRRVLKVEDSSITAVIMAEDAVWPLPTDCKTIRSLSSPYYGEMKYLIPAEFADVSASMTKNGRVYTVVNNNICLIGPVSASEPVELICWYYRKLPTLAESTDDNALLGNYFDVYLYCVLKHTAPFLREDDRLAVWNNLYTTALTSALDENDDRKYAGSPIRIKFPTGTR